MISPAKCRHRNTAINRPLLVTCPVSLAVLRQFLQRFHWKYLYRAIDKDGATLDFYLADRRNAKAAKRFLSAALKRSRDWIPRVINTDKNPAYGEAIAELK